MKAPPPTAFEKLGKVFEPSFSKRAPALNEIASAKRDLLLRHESDP